MRRKVLTTFLAVILLLSVWSVTAFATEPKGNITDTGITIFHASDAAAIEGRYTAGEGIVEAEYDDTTKTVTFTLTNATLNGPLRAQDGLNVNVSLHDSNRISAADSAVFAGSSITFSGNGNLTVKTTPEDAPAIVANDDITVDGTTIRIEETLGNGFYAGDSDDPGSISIKNGATVTGTCRYPLLYATTDIEIDNSTIETKTDTNGIWSVGSLTIKNGSSVNAAGHYSGIAAMENITIADSEVTAYGKREYGMLAPYGDISIQGDNTKVTTKSDAEAIENEDTVDTFPAIHTLYGDILISGGTVIIEANESDGIFCLNNVEISGDNTVVKVANRAGDRNGINTSSLTINGGKVDVQSTGCGIYVDSAPFALTDGELTVTSGTDGIRAWNADMEINNGKLNITSENETGIAANSMILNGGEVSLTVAEGQSPFHSYEDDGLTIADGTLTIPNAAKNDSIGMGYISGKPGEYRNYYYLVTLDAQNNDETKLVLLKKGEKISADTPEKENYTFNGWYDAPSDGEKWDMASDTVNAYMTLYAQWTLNPPSVSVDGEGGNVTADNKGNATITPEEGYRIEKITVNGKEVEIPADGKLTGLKPTDEVVVTFTKSITVDQFTDVKPGEWYYESVKYAIDNGLFYGISDTKFSPNGTMTRGMLVTVLYRMNNEPKADPADFLDVKDDQYYTEAVAWAAANGIVKGYGNGNFGPEDAVTREQLAAILYRYAGSPASTGTLNAFTDGDKASDYALDALKWAISQGIIQGKGDGILDPAGKATRAEVAAMLQRFYNAVNK